MAAADRVLTIAISGSSGSGKTTLTALLKQVLPPRVLHIHADAFGKEFEDLPSYNGVLDADSRNSVRFDALKQTIDHAKSHGTLPDIYESYDFIEADLQKAQDGIRPEYLQSVKDKIGQSKIDWDVYKTIIVVDGFLLYHDSNLRNEFDIKLLLRTTKGEAKLRRFGRYGEREVPEDSEEFWKTTSYFYNCVWRNYNLEHAFLFPQGDVEASLDQHTDAAGLGVWMQPIPDQSFEQTQSWAGPKRLACPDITMPMSRQTQLGHDGPMVPAIGLGLMGLNDFFYKSGSVTSEEQRFGVLDSAHAAGQIFWDTADVYGDNEDMVGKWFQRSGKRADIVLSTKFGCIHVDGVSSLDSSPAHVKSACEQSLKRLRTDYIDVYFCQRADGNTPIEDTIKAMVQLKNEGKILHLGMSQCSADSLRRAHAVHPIAAVQVEYSPFFLDSEINGVFEAAKELGIALVAYAPLGRGLGAMVFDSPNDIPTDDLRAIHPRFKSNNWQANCKLVRSLADYATKKGCTVPQLILAWAMAQPGTVVPIPGATSVDQVHEDAGALNIHISESEDSDIRALIHSCPQSGGIYPHSDTSAAFADTPPSAQTSVLTNADDLWITIS